MTDFRGVAGYEQVSALATRALDTRPGITTGFNGLDSLLHRGSFQAETLVLLGGRMHTRKTTVMLNWINHLLHEGVPTVLLSLDESLPNYVVKLMSVMFGTPAEYIENEWDTPKVQELVNDYKDQTQSFQMTTGRRPSFEEMTQLLEMMEVESKERARVVFVDYGSLMGRDKYAGQDQNRIPRLMEELQVWTASNEVVTVALHQVGRMDDGHAGRRYHGATPMTAESLKYGGEEMADVVLGTYRPALNQLGNMSKELAASVLGADYDEEKWSDAREQVTRYKDSTFLQLLKNRPGVHLSHEGIELVSPNESQFIMERRVDG